MVAAVDSFLPTLSFEEQVLSTVVLLLAGAVLAVWLVPVTQRRIQRLFSDRAAVPEAAAEATERSIAWLILVQLTVRSIQLVVVAGASLAILAVWGYATTVGEIIALLDTVAPTLVRTFVTIGLLAAAWLGTDIVNRAVARFSQGRSAVTVHQEAVLTRVSQLVLFIAVALLTTVVWDLNLDGLLVGAGFLGIVVGLAARQTLGSFIAGFVLMFSRPFEIGDWIVIDDNEGIVTEITVMNTQLRNFDGEFVMLPNDRVNDSVVVNRTREGRLRLHVEVGIDYDTDPERAEQVAQDAIESVDEVVSSPPPQAIPTGFGDSAIVLELLFWIDRPIPGRKWAATRGVVRAVKTAFDEEGIQIPFPQRELSDRGSGFRVVDGENR